MALVRTSAWKVGTTASNVVPIPDPDPNIDRTPAEFAIQRVTLGGRVIKNVLAKKRQWVMSFTAIHDDEYPQLAPFGMAKTPFYLYDPILAGDPIKVMVSAFSDTSVVAGEYNLSITFLEVGP